MSQVKARVVERIGKVKVNRSSKGVGFSAKTNPSRFSLIETRRRYFPCNLCGQRSFELLHSFDDFDLLRCKGCGLVSTTLFVDESILQQMYSSSYYEERQKYYFDNAITNSALTKENDNIRDFKNGLSLISEYKTGGRLLDVGCALGIFLVMAQRAGWDTYGVDVSPYATDFARDIMKLQVRTGALGDIEYPDDWFDVVTVWDAVEHFGDPSKQMREIHRILRDDGIVFMNTPNEEAFMRVLAWKMYDLTKGRFQYPLRKLYHRFHLYYFTAETLKSLLEQNGFEIEELVQKRIPIVKARGNLFEKILVKACSLVDRAFGREYELLAIARKRR